MVNGPDEAGDVGASAVDCELPLNRKLIAAHHRWINECDARRLALLFCNHNCYELARMPGPGLIGCRAVQPGRNAERERVWEVNREPCLNSAVRLVNEMFV